MDSWINANGTKYWIDSRGIHCDDPWCLVCGGKNIKTVIYGLFWIYVVALIWIIIDCAP